MNRAIQMLLGGLTFTLLGTFYALSVKGPLSNFDMAFVHVPLTLGAFLLGAWMIEPEQK